jgi:hypothetical protein
VGDGQSLDLQALSLPQNHVLRVPRTCVVLLLIKRERKEGKIKCTIDSTFLECADATLPGLSESLKQSWRFLTGSHL